MKSLGNLAVKSLRSSLPILVRDWIDTPFTPERKLAPFGACVRSHQLDQRVENLCQTAASFIHEENERL